MTEFIKDRSLLQVDPCGCKTWLLVTTFGANIADSSVEYELCQEHQDHLPKEKK